LRREKGGIQDMSNKDEIISNSDFTRLRNLIQQESGINLNADKKLMVELRIKPRLKTLSLGSYAEYCEYLFGRQGLKDELIHLIDVVTTNKTDFFREPGHFDYLVQKALPEITDRNGQKEVLIWSAGCSTGEEPYTLAIVLSEYAAAHPGFRFKLLATDIALSVLEKASLGIFNEDVVSPVPAALQRKYFMRSRDKESRQLRVVPELRSTIEFKQLNFMDADYALEKKVDAFFCRNVIIYFDRATQERILQKLSDCLLPGGYAFIGHSETLHGMDLPLVPIAPALYRKVDDRT
jgi:chemotaxis protein methyltransferase CheR